MLMTALRTSMRALARSAPGFSAIRRGASKLPRTLIVGAGVTGQRAMRAVVAQKASKPLIISMMPNWLKLPPSRLVTIPRTAIAESEKLKTIGDLQRRWSTLKEDLGPSGVDFHPGLVTQVKPGLDSVDVDYFDPKGTAHSVTVDAVIIASGAPDEMSLYSGRKGLKNLPKSARLHDIGAVYTDPSTLDDIQAPIIVYGYSGLATQTVLDLASQGKNVTWITENPIWDERVFENTNPKGAARQPIKALHAKAESVEYNEASQTFSVSCRMGKKSIVVEGKALVTGLTSQPGVKDMLSPQVRQELELATAELGLSPTCLNSRGKICTVGPDGVLQHTTQPLVTVIGGAADEVVAVGRYTPYHHTASNAQSASEKNDSVEEFTRGCPHKASFRR